MSPSWLVLGGFALVFAGFFLPFLMVLELLEPGLALSFFSHASSLAGLILALAGALLRVRSGRHGD